MRNNFRGKGNFQKRPFNKNKQKEEKPFGAKVIVRNGDVNGALRRLKKILENDNRQKELAKREFYEKPSAKNQRKKSQAKKRVQKERMKNLVAGDAPLPTPSSQKFMKSKRKRRAYSDLRNAFISSKRKRGTL